MKIQFQGKLTIGGKYIIIVQLLGTKFLARKLKVFLEQLCMFWRKNSKLQRLIIHEFQDTNLNFCAKNDEKYAVTVGL